MSNFTRHQEKIIRNYYQNRDGIAVQRLQELVTELYLSTGKKRQQHWKSIVGHLENLKVPQSQIDHLVKEDSPELIANFIKDLVGKS